MAKSEAQLQNEFISEGFISRLPKFDYQKLDKLPTLEAFLIKSAANFIQKVQENIEALGIVDSGRLIDDLTQGDLIKSNKGYTISMGYPKNSKAAKYYDFVNKGVKGVRTGAPNSPYAFKNIGVGKAMLKNIYGWVNRNGAVKRDVSITKRQAKREGLSKMVSEASKKKSLAYAIAVNIKKRGLKKTGYFDNAAQLFGTDFENAISNIVGQDIKILISYGNNNK